MKQQPLAKFRQLCDAEDAVESGAHVGDTFRWNAFGKLLTLGGRLTEGVPIPSSNFQIKQRQLVIGEWGMSVPYTQKLEVLGMQGVVNIIDKVLHLHARDVFDVEVFQKFNQTPLRVTAGGAAGNSLTSINVYPVDYSLGQTPAGIVNTVNNAPLATGHIKAIVDTMKETYNIPPFVGDDYVCVTHVSTIRPFKNELEALYKYTQVGIDRVFNGEAGRYEGVRFIEQNLIPKGGAATSVTFMPLDGLGNPTLVGDTWTNAQSSWAFFIGADTVTEAFVVPEEVRAALPADMGRSKAIGWYALAGFGLVHPEFDFARIVKWDSKT